jgi:hypothetical protein
MNIDPEDANEVVDSTGSTEGIHADDLVAQTTSNPPDAPRNRKRKVDKREALDASDEAIADFLSTPRSVRELKSFTKLAEHLGVSRMTVYRRSKNPMVLQRVQSLLRHHELAGDLVAKLNWPRIMQGLVKAAAAGDVRAAQFCLDRAWPEHNPLSDILNKINNSTEE